MGLVLTRRERETIVVTGITSTPIVITVLKARSGTGRVMIEAHKDVKILRGELTQDETKTTHNRDARDPVDSEAQSQEHFTAPLSGHLVSRKRAALLEGRTTFLGRSNSGTVSSEVPQDGNSQEFVRR